MARTGYRRIFPKLSIWVNSDIPHGVTLRFITFLPGFLLVLFSQSFSFCAVAVGFQCAIVMGHTSSHCADSGGTCWQCNGHGQGEARNEGCGDDPAKRADHDPIGSITKVKPVWPSTIQEKGTESPLTSVAAAAALSQECGDDALQKMMSTGSFSAKTGAISRQSDISDLDMKGSLYSGSDCSTRSSHRKHCTKLKLVETMGHVPSTALQLVINNPRSLVHVYELDAELGKGAFGTVRLGCIRATGAKRAIKTISSLSRDSQKQFFC